MNKKIILISAITIGISFLTFTNQTALMQTNRNAESTTNNKNTSADMIGNLSTDEFERINAEGNKAVAAITPESGSLSRADQKLMNEVAMGGMMQLEVSRAALEKVTSPEAKLLAQSEVEEQTGVSAKLKEIATANNFTLPTATNSKTRALIAKMNGMSGDELDVFYIRESGVKGHEKLQKVMTKVQSKAKAPSMKSLAVATLPVIRMHMQVSREEVAKKSSKKNQQ